MDRINLHLDRAALALAIVVLVLGAGGGPGWTDASHAAVLGSQLERAAGAPLYGVIAGVAAYLPIGEPGFRLALLGAVLGAVTLLGVIRAARALLPNDPIAGLVAAVLLVLAPPFRDAAGFAGPSILAASGVVWSFAFAAAHARAPSPPRAITALACVAIVVGSAPWLGAALGLVIVGWLARTASAAHLALGVAAIGALAIVLWIGALGALPEVSPSLTAMVARSGGGAAAIVIGAGLLGAGFAAVTGLPAAGWLALVIGIAGAHAVVFDPAPVAMLGLLAIGSAVVPGAIVRVVPGHRHRHLVAAVAGLPLLGAAVLTGPALGVDDPNTAPARLATDLLDDVPPGPGVFITTRPTTWAAIEYAQLVAGARPDLVAVPPLPEVTADVIAANALRGHKIAAADLFAFGRLDPRRAFPRGRGFELLGAEPTRLAPVRPPARYGSAIGEREAVLLAMSLARYEGGFGRLAAAAHAAGLSSRFGAADLAILATAAPMRPALLGFLPSFETPAGAWMLELLGDDLAWVAALEPTKPIVEGPPARRLHALWREVLAGSRPPDDPAIAALGPAAVAATTELLGKLAAEE